MLDHKLFQSLKKMLWPPVASTDEPIDSQKHLEVQQEMRIEDKVETKNEFVKEVVLTEQDRLAQCGFTASQILALFYLRQWYQSGGSDRCEVIKHLEFLKRLFMSGKIEL